jgi:phosphatidylserine/phosphatidylglycerophosphate/cardiolipin synthase-like enzyme
MIGMTTINRLTTIKILNKAQYYKKLVTHISSTRSNERVLVMTMSILPNNTEVAYILESLKAAARRGVRVTLVLDSYNFLVNPIKKTIGPLFFNTAWPPKDSNSYWTELLESIQQLENAGAQVIVSNKPSRAFRNPFSGRSHIKTAVVHNTVYIGGCNLSKATDTDAMVYFESISAADWLYEKLTHATAKKSIREGFSGIDQQFALDNKTSILIDSGAKEQSLIYDTALRMIDDSQNWVLITCQFFPNSNTAARLLAAHERGVQVNIIYNNPQKHAGLYHKALQSLVRNRERLRMPSNFFSQELPVGTPFLHAKIIATDNGGIIGSHNYVKAGVDFGTAEIAFCRTEPQFGEQLRDFVLNLTKQ